MGKEEEVVEYEAELSDGKHEEVGVGREDSDVSDHSAGGESGLSFEDAESDEGLSEIFEGLDDGNDGEYSEGEDIESDVMKEALEMSRDIGGEEDSDWERRVDIRESQERRSRDWKTANSASFLEEMVVHCGHVARHGLMRIEEEYEKSFSALHLLFILASQIPLSCFMDQGATKILRTMVSVGYRCSSIRLPSALNNFSLPADWNYLLDLTKLELGSQRLQNLLDQLAAQSTNSKIYSLRRLASQVSGP